MVKAAFPQFEFMWLAEEMKKNLPLELAFTQEGRNSEKVGIPVVILPRHRPDHDPPGLSAVPGLSLAEDPRHPLAPDDRPCPSDGVLPRRARQRLGLAQQPEHRRARRQPQDRRAVQQNDLRRGLRPL